MSRKLDDVEDLSALNRAPTRTSSLSLRLPNSFQLREQNQFSLGDGYFGCVSNHLGAFSWHIPCTSADRHAGNRDVLVRNFPPRVKVSRCNHNIDLLIRLEQNARS